jgi:hypothetical protein
MELNVPLTAAPVGAPDPRDVEIAELRAQLAAAKHPPKVDYAQYLGAPNSATHTPATPAPVLPQVADPNTMPLGVASLLAQKIEIQKKTAQTLPGIYDPTQGILGFRGDARNHPDFRPK